MMLSKIVLVVCLTCFDPNTWSQPNVKNQIQQQTYFEPMHNFSKNVLIFFKLTKELYLMMLHPFPVVVMSLKIRKCPFLTLKKLMFVVQKV